MKRIILVIANIALLSSSAIAAPTAQDLMGVGMPPAQAVLVASVYTNGAEVANNTYLKATNAAGTSAISMLKVDGTDDTVLNADTGDVIKLAVAGTTEVQIGDDSLTFSGAAASIVGGATSLGVTVNALPVWSFTGTSLVQDSTNGGGLRMSRSGAAINKGIELGTNATTSDVGTTHLLINDTVGATEASILKSTADAVGSNLSLLKSRSTDGTANTIVSSGDVIGRINFQAANGTTFDNAARIYATVATTPGAATDMPGSLVFQTTPDGSATLTTALTIESDQDLLLTGDIYAADGADFGFAAANGANTACNTTCTTGCVMGWDQGTTAFVACSSALADSCICTK